MSFLGSAFKAMKRNSDIKLIELTFANVINKHEAFSRFLTVAASFPRLHPILK